MDRFLYDSDLCHERVNSEKGLPGKTEEPLLSKCFKSTIHGKINYMRKGFENCLQIMT